MKKLLSTTLLLLIALTSLAQKKAEFYAVFQMNGTLTVYYDDNEPDDSYHFRDRGTFPKESVITVVFDKSVKNYRPTSCKNWFAGCRNLRNIDGLEYLNTSEVTDMSGMFAECYMIDSLNLSHFDTRKVTDMSGMFAECNVLKKIDISGFDTRNVANMNKMFCNCYNIKTDILATLNVQNVQDTTRMSLFCYNNIRWQRIPWHKFEQIQLGDCGYYATPKQILNAKKLTNVPEGYSVAAFKVSATIRGYSQDATSSKNEITTIQRQIMFQVENGKKIYIEDIKLRNDSNQTIISVAPIIVIKTDKIDQGDEMARVKLENGVATLYYGEKDSGSISGGCKILPHNWKYYIKKNCLRQIDVAIPPKDTHQLVCWLSPPH